MGVVYGRWALLALGASFVWACGDAPVPQGDSVSDSTSDAASDAGLDGASDASGDAGPDATEVGPVAPLITQNPVAAPTVSLLDGTGKQSCSLYQESVCEGGTRRECRVFDASAGAFVTPDPLTHRALLWERWHDLYHAPGGMAVKRQFKSTVAGDATEAEWGDPTRFKSHNGFGDSAIWTGVAVNALVLRYAVTGTEADYQRMERRVRDLVRMFDVTGIPGFLARFHYYEVPSGAPLDPRLPLVSADEGVNPKEAHWRYAMTDLASIDGLPAVYTDGYVDASGKAWTGKPMWAGSPTIDQYSGATTSLPAAWGLLRDQSLKDRIARHLTCYLHRLRRVELIHIQSNPEARDAIDGYFGEGPGNQGAPGDFDFSKLDRVVLYVLEQPNALNAAEFDRTCPDAPQLVATRVLDATSDTFTLDLLALAGDLDGKKQLRKNGIDHFYVPSARGADAVHMMYLAAMAWHMTGKPMYRDFLEQVLIKDIGALDVADAYSAFVPPKWCRKWYADHISIPPLWAFTNLLADSALRTRMLHVLYDEAWVKNAAGLDNIKFALLVGGAVPATVGPDAPAAGARAAELLTRFGGNGGVLDNPRRSYARAYADVVAALPDTIQPVCPSDAVVSFCETGPEIFGVAVPGTDITDPCTGAADECPAANGECTHKMASAPLPPELRAWYGFTWQGDPYGLSNGGDGTIQSNGSDLFEPYWLARYYGLLPEAAGLVLAWDEGGACVD